MKIWHFRCSRRILSTPQSIRGPRGRWASETASRVGVLAVFSLKIQFFGENSVNLVKFGQFFAILRENDAIFAENWENASICLKIASNFRKEKNLQIFEKWCHFPRKFHHLLKNSSIFSGNCEIFIIFGKNSNFLLNYEFSWFLYGKCLSFAENSRNMNKFSSFFGNGVKEAFQSTKLHFLVEILQFLHKICF